MDRPIQDMTEQETIETVMRLYTKDEKAVRAIGQHIAEILVRRRKHIRERRAKKVK